MKKCHRKNGKKRDAFNADNRSRMDLGYKGGRIPASMISSPAKII
jgi:hypothetical protein